MLLFFLSSPAVILNSPEKLNNYQPNQKLKIQGIIIKETYSKNYKILHLDNNLELQCDSSCPSLLNKKIEAITILEKYNNKNYLKILKIKTIS